MVTIVYDHQLHTMPGYHRVPLNDMVAELLPNSSMEYATGSNTLRRGTVNFLSLVRHCPEGITELLHRAEDYIPAHETTGSTADLRTVHTTGSTADVRTVHLTERLRGRTVAHTYRPYSNTTRTDHVRTEYKTDRVTPRTLHTTGHGQPEDRTTERTETAKELDT